MTGQGDIIVKITDMTVSSLASAVEKGELTPGEITAAYLCRIGETDEKINAYITVCADKALEAAAKADRGDVPAVKRLPFAVKDNIAVSGVKMTCASRMLENFVPQYNASVVEKMGGIVLGKTNLDEFAMGSSCEKSIIGATCNPISPERSAGGSSGGSAAAVCAKCAPWALGTDTGGSARQPSAFCGVVSMKPTYGLVSRFGVTEFASSLDTVCPITRNVYDCALVLEHMAGNDARDMTSVDKADFAGEYTSAIDENRGVHGLRIGLTEDFEPLCGDAVISCTLRAAQKLERLGASVERVKLPEADSVLGAYLVISQAECSSNLSRYDGLKYGCSAYGDDYREIMRNSRAYGFGDEVKRRILAGCYALSESHGGNFYSAVKRIRSDIRREAEKLWERYDVILSPTSSDCAFRLGSYDEDPTKLYGSDIFTVFANLTGIPAIQLPSGGDGLLPCGVSLMAGKYSEGLLFSAASVLEGELKDYISAEVGYAL